jgi:hypothetical protein
LSVPLRLLVLVAGADAVLVEVLVAVGDELEEHAARATAQTASPAVVTCRLRRRCISGTPYRFYRVSGRTKQPLLLQTVVCEYSLSAPLVPAGKSEMDKSRLES